MDCSTIIVSYNTYDLTRQAILAALDAADHLAHEVIVVDNASPDGSGRRLEEEFADRPDVRVLALDENLGFARANNLGARHASGEMLYFLNPDTLAAPGSTEVLYRFLTGRPEAGAVGPRVLNEDGTEQASSAAFPTAANLLRHHWPVLDMLRGRDRREDPVPAATMAVEVVKGCALGLRRAVFEVAGGWDERYFLYAEEVELCFSLARLGYRNYFVREAEIVHYGGASAATDDYVRHQVLNAASASHFLHAHYGAPLVWLNRFAGATGFAARAMLFRILALLRPEKGAGYRLRGRAASALCRWYLLEHP